MHIALNPLKLIVGVLEEDLALDNHEYGEDADKDAHDVHDSRCLLLGDFDRMMSVRVDLSLTLERFRLKSRVLEVADEPLIGDRVLLPAPAPDNVTVFEG